MTILNWFILGLGYGACALGIVLRLVGMVILLAGFAAAVQRMARRDEDGAE